ncbi:lipopolysaccharide biosynthesis protein [Parabacteroides goldsteinii]|jgi:O-antigen/teichoic acid export membrane protein|uniref:lipopolysaccharide biosynthesis protein n=1 Tax=Parabacteroides goldsteinii TaxID=328812 RepID=UPI001E0D1E0E|nr:hypothetical protein [Parabacteroides goldsteinii]MBS6577933.1 hypothetical protein [Parabacteroides goldsteinii]
MSDNLSNNKRIVKNSLFLSLRMVIVLGITLYTTRVVLAILGVEDYGVYNVICGFVSMFAFLNTSMSNGIQRFYNYELGKHGIEGVKKVFGTSVIIQLILAIIIIILCESFGLWYLYNKMVIPSDRLFAASCIFQFSMVSFLFLIMQAPFTAAVMAHERMDFFAIINVIDAILKLGMVLVLPYLHSDRLILYGALQLIITILDFIWYFIYCKRSFKEIKLRNVFSKELFGSMMSFSGWNLFGSFSNMMREQGVNIILNLFFGPVVNAARGIATQINAGASGFVQNILTPVRPQVIQSYAKGEIERSMSLTFSISKFSLSFFYMICLPICLEINYILHLWLGKNVPNHTDSFVIIILITTAVLILMGALATLVHASGKMRNYQVIGSIIKFLSVPISYFILKYGAAPEWAFVMVLFFDIIGFIVGMFIIKTIMTFSIIEYTTKVIVPVIPIVVLSYILITPITYIMSESFIRFSLVLILSILVVGLLFLLIGLNKQEKILISQIISNIIKNLKKQS